MATQEIKVPDIGGYDDVPVIEVLVAVGDTVDKDQGLVTLESDKATMEVPSSVAGVVKELKVKVGDTLSEGGVVAVIETQEAADASAAADVDDAERSEEHTSELQSLMRISSAVFCLKKKPNQNDKSTGRKPS